MATYFRAEVQTQKFSLPDDNNSDGDSSPISKPEIPNTIILYAHTESDRMSLCIKLHLCVLGVVVATQSAF